MQTIRDGHFAEIEKFTPEALEMKFQDSKVEHVEVFRATQENLEQRQLMIGKKYTTSQGYKKAPKIDKK